MWSTIHDVVSHEINPWKISDLSQDQICDLWRLGQIHTSAQSAVHLAAISPELHKKGSVSVIFGSPVSANMVFIFQLANLYQI